MDKKKSCSFKDELPFWYVVQNQESIPYSYGCGDTFAVGTKIVLPEGKWCKKKEELCVGEDKCPLIRN